MKKYVSILLTVVLLIGTLALSGCNSNVAADDLYVKDQGKLVVGVIDAPPLSELNDEGEWTGLSVDLARDFGKKLGVDVEFKEIEWTEMEHLLNDKTIDCVASALTLTADRRAVMECTKAYLNNSQIVVTKASVARRYTEPEQCLQLKFAVLDGSTHEALAKENGFLIIVKETTDEVLKAVSDGSANAAIINSTFATTAIGNGNEYPDLARAFRLKNNKIGFAFRKNSELAEQMNAYFVTAYTSGKMAKLAKNYSVQKLLVEQVTEK
ncbi:MAG: amino acid ABC transporter substrate-binding protein [Clostridia bacterium]|nr:amino acid ABC transporter substrate-binding protein [Clostridia bacterium]